ncbi:Protein FAM136A [Pseudolycoriella hygida]|uniref:Protein FAM136A n=1 Tax=Pseudolycoriella hygida TaxID=35572 RepID=A0A9Q0S2S6_9DIPT|nr:Protein FAM136A [Pseudolycoriella hygida]
MSVTIEQQRQRVEQEMTKNVDDLDRSFLRKIQADMHFCAAKCCEDKTSSIDSVQACVERCSVPLNKAQRYVHTELEGFQGRLQRCVMQCNDEIKNQMPPSPSEGEVAKYTNQFERCAIKCVDKHVDLIPNLFKTMKTVLNKGANHLPDA